MNHLRAIVFLIKNHWLVLTLIVGAQFISGKIMAGDAPYRVNLATFSLISAAHELIGTLILVASLILAASKNYLILRTKKIRN